MTKEELRDDIDHLTDELDARPMFRVAGRLLALLDLPEGAEPWGFEDGIGAEIITRRDLEAALFGGGDDG